MMSHSALYFGTVIHQRHKPKRHRLRYGVFSMLVDLDDLAALSDGSRLFGYNRAAPFSFHDADHGTGEPGSLQGWVDTRLADAGYDLTGGRILLLCYPRIFGYVFNPLSIYYCFDAAGNLAVLLYEVSNTFGERHTYIIPVDADAGRVVRQECDKRMYVSPFIPMECRYKFAMTVPGERLSVIIDQHDATGPLLVASFNARRKPFSDSMLALALFRFPLMTVKVMAAIHWEAFRLWWKGLPLVPRKPADKAIAASVVKPPHPARS